MKFKIKALAGVIILLAFLAGCVPQNNARPVQEVATPAPVATQPEPTPVVQAAPAPQAQPEQPAPVAKPEPIAAEPQPTIPTEPVKEEVVDNQPDVAPVAQEEVVVKELTKEDFNKNSVVYYDFDMSSIKKDQVDAANLQAEYLAKNPAKLVIEGHADARGTREYNIALGKRRAESLKSYIVGKGVPSNSVKTISFGEEKPAVSGSTEAAYAKNRRTKTVLLVDSTKTKAVKKTVAKPKSEETAPVADEEEKSTTTSEPADNATLPTENTEQNDENPVASTPEEGEETDPSLSTDKMEPLNPDEGQEAQPALANPQQTPAAPTTPTTTPEQPQTQPTQQQTPVAPTTTPVAPSTTPDATANDNTQQSPL